MLRDPSLIPLSHQHQHGLALAVLTERALKEDSSAAKVEELAKRCIERYEIELTNHFEIEERILFPAFSDPLVEELIAEHREMEALIGQMRQGASAELLLRFTALLAAHIRKEESQLFEEMQKRLPRETLDALGKEIDAKAVRVCL